jgi:hypothetical protein
MITRLVSIALAICIFQIPVSNAMQANSLCGEFLDIMGRQAVSAPDPSIEKATYLQILRRAQTTKLAKKICTLLKNFDTNGYFTLSEQIIVLEKINALNTSLDVWVRTKSEGPDTIDEYPRYATLARRMKDNLEKFCIKIECSHMKYGGSEDASELFSSK